MLSNRARLALTDIRDNIRLAEQFASGLSVEALRADRRTFYAVTRCLEIISEAARRLPQNLRNRHSELPWRAIMGAGNVYRHDYDNVAEEIVWRTVQNNLAPLLAAVERELARAPKNNEGYHKP
ncbi:MAG: HepT-like ribonuclease domain-containing protein [Stellaceae bacterium]